MNYEQFEHTINDQNKKIFLVDMTQELNPYYSQLMLKGIEKTLSKNQKVAIIINKKGYSNGIICNDCGWIPQCKNCSVSISFYKIISGETIGICNICKAQYNLPKNCDDCKSQRIKEFGIGTQKLGEFIEQEYNIKPLIIESEKVNSNNKIQKILENIENQKIVIGTSLLSNQINKLNFDLVIYLNADLGLSIPDFNSSLRNFYFLYEGFVKHQSANFIVQSFNINHYSIRNACKLSKEGFEIEDNKFKKEHNYPPYKDLCIILYKNEIEDRLFTKVDKLYKELLYLREKYDLKDIEIYSTPPLIYKIFGKYRYNIILKGENLRNFVDIIYSKLNLNAKGFKINRKAESIV